MQASTVQSAQHRCRCECVAAPLTRQRGVVLAIALVVLVAMALAAVALTRAIDISNIAAGNLAFKQSALSATDLGVREAMNRVASMTDLNADQAPVSYYATIQPSDKRGVPNALLASNLSAFDPIKLTAPGSGETVRYLIDRQCVNTGPPSEAVCNYTAGQSAPGGSASSAHTGAASVPLMRVTVRVDGPKNTVSFSQVVFRP